MSKEQFRNICILLVCVIAIFVLAFFTGYRYGLNHAIIDSDVKVDTILVHDTIMQYEPIYKEKRIVQKVLVPIEKKDTLWRHDTLLIPLNREQVVWKDSLSCVYASGINPQVDSVRHYVTHKIITKELTQVVKKPTRWGVGIQAGYGVTLQNKQVKGVPYVGVGLTYNIITW